jgi:hypothetical protein
MQRLLKNFFIEPHRKRSLEFLGMTRLVERSRSRIGGNCRRMQRR